MLSPRRLQARDAKITPGFRLPARYVVHTVGPVWRGGGDGEPDVLASCYRRCLQLAQEHGLRTIAFPCIGTGAYGYPREAAAGVAVTTVRAALGGAARREEVVFCCFSPADLELYERELAAAESRHKP